MKRIKQPSARAGFALPATLLAMFVIGAIVTGGFYIAGQEHNVSVSTDIGAQALQAAEYGIEETLAYCTNDDFLGLTPGQVTPFEMRPGDMLRRCQESATVARMQTVEGAEYTVAIVPLRKDTLYMIQAEGRVVQGRDTATRRVARLVGAARTDLPYKSAMSIVGQLTAAGNSMIDGNDQCTIEKVPGVVAQDAGLVTGITKNTNTDPAECELDPSKCRIIGNPAVEADADIINKLNAYDLQKLVDQAEPQYRFAANADPSGMAPSTYVGSDGQTYCNTDDSNNWGGAPACEDHYPVMFVDGNFKLTTGSGQGVLIVDGDLEIAGNIEFSGVVIVTGTFTMKGTGSGTGKVNGSVIAMGASSIETEQDISGNALVQYNSCEIEKALNSAYRLTALASRGWIIDPPPL